VKVFRKNVSDSAVSTKAELEIMNYKPHADYEKTQKSEKKSGIIRISF